MKNNIVLIFLVSIISVAFGQEKVGDGQLKSRFRPGIMWNFTGFKPAKAEKGFKYDRLLFDITYNDWVGDRGPFKLKGPSMGMNVSFMFDFPLDKNGTVSFAVGPQYGFYNTRHDLAYQFNFEEDYTTFDIQQNAGDMGMIKAVGNYLQVPIEFRFRTKGWQHFKFHIGGRIGYLFAFNEKSKWQENDVSYVRKDYSTPDISRLLYSAHIRFGIRNWAIYASYNFNPMFKNEQSTKLNQFQLGLTISLY